jgi:hypothetical protein
MNALVRHSVWVGRLVLAGATLLFVLIGIRYVLHPIDAVAPHRITLGSSEAVTNIRVSGGVFLGMAAALFACMLSERRILAGTGVLALVSVAVTAARLFGLAVDGPAPFTLHVLRPEVALVVLSTLAFLLETRRLQDRQRMTAPVRERLA